MTDLERERLFRLRLAYFDEGMAQGWPPHVARRFADARKPVDLAQRDYEFTRPTLFSQPRFHWIDGRPPAEDPPYVPPRLPPLPAANVVPMTRPFDILRDIVSGRRNGM